MHQIALKTLDSQEWQTPQKLFNELDKEFHFNLDPCATDKNKKCANYFTKEEDGLKQKWFDNVFVNPPFKDVSQWVKKAFEERKNCNVIVMLLAARTDTRWFHKYVYGKQEIRFIKGRVKYKLNGKQQPAPFPSMIVIFRKVDKH